MISGTFFPLFTLEQINYLKIASLYFDRIFLLTPISIVSEVDFKDQYRFLAEKLLQEFGDILGLEPANGEILKSESFVATVDLYKQAKVLIEADVIQMVNPFDIIKNAGLTNEFRAIIEYRARQAESRKKRSAERMGRSEITRKLELLDLMELTALTATTGKKMNREMLFGSGLLQARTDTLRSIMYDSAVLVSRKNNSIPITGDDRYNHEFINHITEIMADSIEQLERFRFRREQDGYKIMSQSIVENVPAFERASFNDILHLRQHCSDELMAFRQEVKKLATSLSEGVSDDEKAKEIQAIVSKEINPIIVELERKVRLSRRKWAQKLIEKTTSVQTVASLASTVFIGLPLQYGLLAAATLAGVQTGLEVYFDIQEIKTSNGLSFILRLRERYS